MFSLGMMVGGIAPDTKSAGVIASLLLFSDAYLLREQLFLMK